MADGLNRRAKMGEKQDATDGGTRGGMLVMMSMTNCSTAAFLPPRGTHDACCALSVGLQVTQLNVETGGVERAASKGETIVT